MSSFETLGIGGHVFRIPKEYLLHGTIPWLPSSQSDAIKFVVNPNSQIHSQNIVTVEAHSAACAQQKLIASPMLQRVCDEDNYREPVSRNESGTRLIRRFLGSSAKQWEYWESGVAENPSGGPVASCFAMESSKTGLCVTLGTYGDLVYSLRVTDSDIEHLSELKQEIRQLLNRWEVKT
jgi:hypothetical protein